MDGDQLQERCNNLGSGGFKPVLCVENSFELYCCVPSPSLVTADLVYIAADDVNADASSHQNDIIANQAHVADADEVSVHFSPLSWIHTMVFFSCLTYFVCVCVRTLFLRLRLK